MNYRSISDLSDCIRANLHKLPADADLIVGIPRSGVLAASMIALNSNRHFCDIEAYIADTPLQHGATRPPRRLGMHKPSEARHVLVIDDSIYSGESMRAARNRMSTCGQGHKITYIAVYATHSSANFVDMHFEIIKPPRFFEWNLMHRKESEHWCFDFDGVLCVDPTDEENDDGASYIEFLSNAKPLAVPSHPVGHIVTSRLEKYRLQTEAWLKHHGIIYGTLHMLNLPDATTRRRLGSHARFKSDIYRHLTSSSLFIESNETQSREIARASGKAVICFQTQTLHMPEFNLPHATAATLSLLQRGRRKLLRIAKKISGA